MGPVVEDVVNDAIVALDPNSQVGAAFDHDFGEQLGGGQLWRGIERKMLESRVLLADGVLGEVESVEEHQQRAAFRRLFGKPKLHGPYHKTSWSTRPPGRASGAEAGRD